MELTDKANHQVRTLIHEHIKSFNDGISKHHKSARAIGTHPLHLIVYDTNDVIIGGLIANTYWGWLDIDDFWIERSRRGQGLGSTVLQTAEHEAIARNCLYSQLKTFSFQAQGFYEKCGYRVTGELKNYPPGHSLYWMVKELF